MVKNGFGQSGFWTLKLTVSQEWNDEINYFFAYRYKFMQIKRQLKIFGVDIVKNGCDQSVKGSLKFNLKNEQME